MGGLILKLPRVPLMPFDLWFLYGHISRTSRNLDLDERGFCYERSCESKRLCTVADIAAALFEKCCGAEVCPGIVDAYPKAKESITLRPRAFGCLLQVLKFRRAWFSPTRLSRVLLFSADNGERYCSTNSAQILRVRLTLLRRLFACGRRR